MAPARQQCNGSLPLANTQGQINSSSSKSKRKLTSPSNSPNPNPNSNNSKKNPKQQKSQFITPSKPFPASTPSHGYAVVGRRIRVYRPIVKVWHEGFVAKYDGSRKKHLVKYDDGDEESLDFGEEKIKWISLTPVTPSTPYYEYEVVNRRIRVYWPLDNAWHEGFVKSYDSIHNKYSVEYDDGGSESLDMGKEKIEWTPSYGQEVVDRRIRVYWPLDEEWYEGFVMQYDGSCKKHLVKYDDGDDGFLDLRKENIEWVASNSVPLSTPSYGHEVVDRRIRVYWPLDEAWHEGFVKRYDRSRKKHLVRYDDGDEEVLGLRKEKIEWITSKPVPPSTPLYGQEVIGRRIRIYWPIDKAWHKGFVVQCDGSRKEHLVKYDDGDEESLDLGEEKIKWISSKPIPPSTPSQEQEVVGRRIRVYWSLDDAWHEGFVERYDESRKKHLVKYDDGDSESLDLGKEKIEWTPSYGQEVVDRRIRVYWQLDNSWHEGFVMQYDGSSKKYLVKYDGGDNESLDLGKKKIEWTPSYGQEVVERRIRVYWPLHKAWHDGFITRYDGSRKKHLVKYNDGDEEVLDLRKEKIEWISSEPVLPSTPSYGQESYGHEIVDKRIRVYWSLDKAWHEGFVTRYDGSRKKHLVRYDYGDEEVLDLGKEKIEWVTSNSVPPSIVSYGHEVVDRRIRVYWPLDEAWHEGFVTQYDKSRKKHLVKYDDGDEEVLDLGKEKIEWIASNSIPLSTPSYGHEVVDRRIRVYLPLDKAWHEGFVMRYDGSRKKHLVKYDDGDGEVLDLGKEKIEWIEESTTAKKMRKC